MRVKNISEFPVKVGNVNGVMIVAPDEVVLTAGRFALPLIKSGQLEEVPEVKAKKKATPKTSTPKKVSESRSEKEAEGE